MGTRPAGSRWVLIPAMGGGLATFAIVHVFGRVLADGKFAFGSVFAGMGLGYLVFVALLYGLDRPPLDEVP